MKNKIFYITTPIYYASGDPHIGHTYSTVAADVMARFKRLQGYDVMFLTGMDEHGQKVEHNALKNKKTPQAYVDELAQVFKNMWSVMNISYDKFIRTTSSLHKEAVQKIFDKLYEKGEIYKGKYKGWYCLPCEAFFTENQLKERKCPDCGREVKWSEEEAYFFKLSKYADKLLDYYKQNKHFIQPEGRKNEMIQFIEQGLEDLCVTRTSFSWGVPVNIDKNHVVYVWLDALSNYITAQGYLSENDEDFKKYWPANVHFVGKEIARFHAIIWPAILMALDLPLPKQIYAHGWILFGDGEKMSKSKGNIVDPKILCSRYGTDAIRYFLMREFSFGLDGLFTNESLIKRINFDLANDLGNLVSRTITMIEKYFNKTLPENKKSGALDTELSTFALNTSKEFELKMEKYKFSAALSEVWLLISKCNKYIDETMPWELGKNESKYDRLASVLYNLCEALRIISVLISPVMPETSKHIQKQLNASNDCYTWESLKTWGILPSNLSVHKEKILFPRIDIDAEIKELESLLKKNEEDSTDFINIEDFLKVNLIVGKVLQCEPVKKSKKLLKLLVNDGSKNRTVVSGIALHYKPEDLINRNVILVSNLKPVKLCGVESNGMIVATQTQDGSVKVIFPDDSIEPGSKLS